MRSINLQLMVEVSGAVRNPSAAVGAGNVAVIKGDTKFAYPIGACTVPVINRDFTLKLDNGGNPCSYSGPISGSGKVEIYAGGPNAPLTLDGKAPNTMQGTWLVKAGRLVLAKRARRRRPRRHDHRRRPGRYTACSGTPATRSTTPPQIQLLSSDKGGASLNLNGFSDTIDRLTLAAGTKVLTSGPHGGGVLTVRELWVDGKRLPKGVYTSSAGWLHGSGYVVVGDVKYVDVVRRGRRSRTRRSAPATSPCSRRPARSSCLTAIARSTWRPANSP